MEVKLSSFLLCVAIAWVSFHFIFTATKRSKFNRKRLPPGPFPLPIVGNIFSLRDEPLKALTDLAKTYGPVMSLRLGSLTTVVITSASMAKEVLQIKDSSFANRYVPDCLTAHDYHKFSMGLRPPDESWRLCRKFFTSHVFAKSRLDNTQALRKQKVEDLLSYVEDLMVAGTETSANVLEWAMAELMQNPNKMKKAQEELNEVIGKGNLLKEEDPVQLPYLQAVVKEAIRMHAPSPFLVPRSVCEDISLGHFIVPKNSQILVNVYAIHKDPTLWDNPEHFEPERFLGSSIDFQRHSFEFLPFGSGRRGCPGQPLATRMVHLMLGSLIHAFDWKFEDGVTPKTLNMKEKVGVTLHKAKPLCIIPVHK